MLQETIKLMKKPKTKVFLIPDIPTGADILDEGLFEQINETGNGKITLQATPHIDHNENIIKFTSLPLQTSSSQVISKIIEKKKKGEFQEIIDILDYTKLGEVDLRIVLKSDANPKKVLQKLYEKSTGLRDSIPVSLKMIDDYRCYEYSVQSFLEEWIEYRRDIVRSMFSNDLIQTLEKQHMNAALLVVFAEDNAQTTLKICKNPASRKDTIEKLMKHYASIHLTSLQAATIADMRLYHFNKDTYARYKEEKKKLKEDVDRITKTLNSDKLIDEFIIKQLEEGIKRYGRPRKSRVIRDEKDVSIEQIPSTEHLVAITPSGIIKKVSAEKHVSMGTIGNKNENFVIVKINNREDLLVIDSHGYAIRVPVSMFPNMKGKDPGVELSRYVGFSGKIITVMKMPPEASMKEKNNTVTVSLITKEGMAKRTPLSEFKGMAEPRQCITLNPKDELVAAFFATEDVIPRYDCIIYTSLGKGVRVPMESIKSYGRVAKGNLSLKLDEGDCVTGANMIDPSEKVLFLLSSNGYGKITQLKYFPVTSKKDGPLQLMPLPGRNESLIFASAVNPIRDEVVVYFKHDAPAMIPLEILEFSTRKSRGDRIVKVPRGDAIVSVKITS